MPADPLLAHRTSFPILESCTYLVSHSLGAMPEAARTALGQYTTEWATRGVRAWHEGWWEAPVEVGDELAPLVGAPPGSIAMVQNVSTAQTVLASCFDLRPPRNRVVFSGLNFPTVMYVWHGVPGAEVVTVPSPDGITIPTEALLEAIDERTAVVPISHVIFRSGYLQDVAAITERAHAVGARVLLDCYQTAGTLPFSLADLGVDAACGGSVKWLCGGPGAGWLYVRPDLQEVLTPWATGWQADREPFAFRPGPIERARGIWRFLGGSPAVPCLYAARASYRLIREVGVAAIREKSVRQTEWLIAMADELGLAVHTPRDPDRRGGSVILAVPDEERVAQRLIEREVLVDARPGAGVRIGPHFYTSDEELEHLREELVAILSS
jgi:kynureninase